MHQVVGSMRMPSVELKGQRTATFDRPTNEHKNQRMLLSLALQPFNPSTLKPFNPSALQPFHPSTLGLLLPRNPLRLPDALVFGDCLGD